MEEKHLNLDDLFNNNGELKFKAGSTEVFILNNVKSTKALFLYKNDVSDFTIREHYFNDNDDIIFSFFIHKNINKTIEIILKGALNELRNEKILLSLYDYKIEGEEIKLLQYISYYGELKGGVVNTSLDGNLIKFSFSFKREKNLFTNINDINDE